LKPYLSIMYAVMQNIPRTGSANRLDRVPADAAECALFIDIDGTLLDMAPSPDAVVVPPGLVQTLSRLTRTFGGAVALSTGRRVVDADMFFAPLRLVTSGVHGTEARTQVGGDIAMLAQPVPAALLQAVREVARLSPGILVEEKGAGIAVHYRHAPEMRAAVVAGLERIAGEWDDFDLRSGRRVLDLIPKCCSKGTGLESLMRLPAFRNRLPIMIGDDHGDEPAMLEAQRLGGIGLRVAGEHFSRDRADFDCAASVRCWLSLLASRGAARPVASQGQLPTG
jgi:trehalose 6-phosphate phosphatase